MREVDVRGMLRRNTPRQIQDWLLYEQLEPFGELREDYRAALVASEVANLGTKWRRTPKDGKLFTVEEKLLRFGRVTEAKPDVPAQRKQTPSEQIEIIKIIVAAYAGSRE